VVLLARSESIEKIGAELGGLGVRGSVTEEADLKRLVDSAVEHYGRIDAVVNNTGHPAKGDPLALSDAEWQQGYELILGSVIRLARLVMPVMIGQKCGAFVNISSYAAKQPDAVRPVSSVFRAALSAWTRVHAEAGAAHGIRVNSILPGFVDSYPVGQKIIETIPMGRIGRLEELAKAVAFLLSDDASYITGQNLLLDGGMVRGI
jgi:NAD(P)-dependent dehydrogenase (short-subunit alcohol dehydrogenase family)